MARAGRNACAAAWGAETAAQGNTPPVPKTAHTAHGCWIVQRDDEQIQIKKGLPQSLKGYDSNGYSLFSCGSYRMKVGYGTMKLSRYEQETIVNYNAGEQTATLYMGDKAVMRKLDTLVADFPCTYSLIGIVNDVIEFAGHVSCSFFI